MYCVLSVGRTCAAYASCVPKQPETARMEAFAFSGCLNLPLNLRDNRAVGNLVVFRQQHGFGEDYRERVVALRWDKQLVGCVFFAAVGYDAEVLVVRQHQDVAAADVDFVGTQLALHNEEVAVYVGNLGDFQARQ